MLHLYPEKVEMEQVEDAPPAVLPNYDVLPVRPELTPASGCLSSAAQATAVKGEILLKRATVAMATALDAEFQDVIDNDVEQK
jgi:creatinine amidohydrolase